MDDVMYGVMFNAKIDIWVNEPPGERIKEIECVTSVFSKPLFKEIAIYSRNRKL